MNASLSLTQHETFRAGMPIEVYIVHVPPDRERRLTVLNAIKQEVLGRYSPESAAGERAEEFFEEEERLMGKTFDGSVHTECALLGLLSDGGSMAAAADPASAVRELFQYEGKPLPSMPEIFQVRIVLIPIRFSLHPN